MLRMNLHSLDPVGFRNWIQFLSDNPTQRCQHTNKPQPRQTQKAANNAVKQMNWSALRCILILTYFDTALLQMGCYRSAGKKRVCSFILSKSREVYYEHIWACNRKQLWFQNVSGQLFWPNTGALDKRFLSHCGGIAFKYFVVGPEGWCKVRSLGTGFPLIRFILWVLDGHWARHDIEATWRHQYFFGVDDQETWRKLPFFEELLQRFQTETWWFLCTIFLLCSISCISYYFVVRYAYFAYFVCRSCWKVPVGLFLA